jgi:5'-nucleotidase
MLDTLPDMVVSGINDGANMGDDTIYSGTVAAATEGFLLGVPSLAISLAGFSTGNFPTAARVATEIVRRFETDKLHGPVLLNVNVPDIPYDELQGLEVTRLGRRHKAEPVVKYKTPRGETVYWVGAAGPAQDAGEGTDFLAIQRNRVSVTPLQIDLTRYGQLDTVKEWLNSHALASTRS